ncbi:DUF4844 domain-containing protein [Hymenobacter sp. ASUV-10]|uniref:DUF4844 domain-containing protein n=1 Tax=Hymenobacter aranciens TaxID=3063996 RepID=A0ABT9BDV7_9BACT|nr:DUF4844 domain-containing protein [Hymenobacter sp. ASUV-10]MDO7874871.1 DUF4844 domain-containing protein [Hymenobacter sp. ASUV-10]
MIRILLTLALGLSLSAAYAQTGTTMVVPRTAIGQLEDLMEVTKKAAAKPKSNSKLPAEANPELNRYLVIAADDFVRVTRETPTREAYLAAIDKGLGRLTTLATSKELRQQVADYYLDLIEIVGLDSSDGKLDTFVAQAGIK